MVTVLKVYQEKFYWIKMYFFKAKFFSPLFYDIDNFPNLPKYCFYLPFVVNLPNHVEEFSKKEIIKFLMVAKFQARKNHILLLEALSEIKDSYFFELTIVGEVATPGQFDLFELVQNKISNLKLDRNVKLLLNIPFHQMQSIYLEHDVFILPATNEPASISILEALGYGLPVICSNTCGTSVFVKNGETGYTFENNSLSSLKSVINSLLSKSSNLQLLKGNVKLHANRNFSPNVYYENFMKNLKHNIN